MKQKKRSSFPIFLSDIFFKYKIHKEKVKKFSLIFISLLALFTLLSYPKYESFGSFKCGEEENGSAGSIKDLIKSSNPLLDKPAPIAYFKSKRILYPLIEDLKLQGAILPESKIKSRLKNFKDNLLLEYRFLLRKDPQPISQDNPAIAIQELTFDGKAKVLFEIDFLNEEDFKVKSQYSLANNNGKLGQPFIFPEGSFTLGKQSYKTLASNQFKLVVDTKEETYNEIFNYLTIESDEADPLLLEITYLSKNSALSAAFVNGLMKQYKKFLQEEQDDRNQFQLAYLSKRSSEVNSGFILDLNDYANNIKSLVIKEGYLDSHREIAHLSKLHDDGQSNLLRIENEIKRIKQFKTDDYLYCDNAFNTEAIRELLNKRRANEQRQYSLELALKSGNSQNYTSIKENLQARYQTSLATLKTQLQNVVKASEILEENEALLISSNDPHFQSDLVLNWINEYNNLLPQILDSKENTTLMPVESMRAFYQSKNNLLHYFKENHNLLNIQLKNISFKANEPMEFSIDNTKGVDPETTELLYKKATEELERVQKDFKKITYVHAQIQEADFPINSLSSFLPDSTSQGIIKTSNQLYLDLQDTSNFTQKERVRKQENIKVLRQSLSIHLSRLINLMSLEEDSLQANIFSLQQATLDNSKQKGSILNASLDNIIQTRLESLTNEKKILVSQNKKLTQRMILAPNTWVKQKSLEAKTEINKSLLEEVSKLVETKNVQSNISLINSRPLEIAFQPLYPKNPLVVIKTIFFAILSLSLCFMLFSFQVITKGPNAGAEYLKSIDQNFCGYLSSLANCPFACLSITEKVPSNDLQTIRQLIQDLKMLEGPKVIYTALNTSINYLPHLFHLLNISKTKALVLNFDSSPGEGNELEHYLEGKTEDVVSKDFFDYTLISINTESPFLAEKLQLERFKQLLKQLKKTHPLIFFNCSKPITQGLSKSLFQLADLSIISIKPCLIEEMELYLDNQKSFFISSD
jgi:hypothetical protein